MQGRQWALLVVLAATLGAAPGAVAAERVAAQQLVYQGAVVETQVEVNGVAAVQLVGGAIDALAAQAQEAAKQIQAQGAASGRAAHLQAVLPMIEPAREAIKSLDQITLVIMKPQGEVGTEEFISHYSGLMTAQNWTPLMTVRDKDRAVVVMMMAPEAKGVFFAVNDKKALVSGLVTTSQPMGEVLAKLINSAGGALPMIMSQMSRPKPAPQATAVSTKSKPAPAKTAPKR